MKGLLMVAFWVIAAVLQAQTFTEVEDLIAAERYEEAIDMLQSIKTKDPNNSYVYFGLGETVIQSFKADSFSSSKNLVVKKAQGYFNEGVKADSLNPLNYVGLGIIELYKNGNTYEADRYFDKALSFIPSKKKKILDIHIRTLVKLATAELYSPNPRIDKSREYIKRVKEYAPKSPDVYLAEGDILLYNAANASDAISSYEKALALNNNPLSNVRIGRIYLSARVYDDAQKHFDDALKTNPNFAPAYKGLGDLNYKTGKLEQAKTYYSKFLQLTGNNIPAKISYTKALFLAKDYDEALQEAKDVIKTDSSKNFIFRIAGYAAYYKEPPDLGNARYYMDELFSKASQEQLIPMDYENYGRIILAQNRDSADIAKGVSMLENAYLADTTNVKLISEILKTAYRYKVYPEAAKYLTLLINRGMDTPNNNMFLGKIYYQMQDYASADSAFSKVIAMDTANVEAYLWLGYVSSSLDPEMKSGLAKPYFEQLVTVIADDTVKYRKELSEAYNYLGSYFLLSEKNINLSQSELYFEKLLPIVSNKGIEIKSLHSLAYINAKKKDYLQSKEYYEKILDLNPDDRDAKRGLAFVSKFLKPAKAD